MKTTSFKETYLSVEEVYKQYEQADWKDNPLEVLEIVDKQLQKFGLEIVLLDTKSDSYAWKIDRK